MASGERRAFTWSSAPAHLPQNPRRIGSRRVVLADSASLERVTFQIPTRVRVAKDIASVPPVIVFTATSRNTTVTAETRQTV